MRSGAPVAVKVYFPETEEGKRELSERVAEVHAAFVLDAIDKLHCPIGQKKELLQKVIDAEKEMEGRKRHKGALQKLL